jgi:energy-coupling factor transporter ATP-binding protein EcfA2
MKIEKAIRKSLPAVICLYGESGSGKTFSALKLAHGLVANAKNNRVCVIDTENHRASHYDADFDFDVINLESPFSSSKFIEAIKLAQNENYGAIIIDSISHEWDGIGGAVYQADNSSLKNKIAVWQEPKKEHKKLMDFILSSKCHFILCTRAKAKTKQVGKEIIEDGIVPIQEKTFLYDMLAVFHMYNKGQVEITKCPKNLQLNITNFLNEAHGKVIADWVNDAGASIDLEKLQLQKEARLIAMEGLSTFIAWHSELDKENQELLVDIKKELHNICKEADGNVKSRTNTAFTPTKAPVD